MQKTASLLGALLLVILWGCNPTCSDCTANTTGQEYFPLAVGQYTEFAVSEQIYALGVAPVARTYQIKESIVEQYKDVSGQAIYRIVQYKRVDDTQKWQPDSTLTARMSVDRAVKNENGRDYVKIIFPVSEKLSWDGNIYNNLGENNYVLKNVNKAYQVGNQKFDKTITIVQKNDSTLVGQDKRIEVYAANVGLIYRESANLQFCSSSPTCVGKGQIDYGTKRIVKFVKNGKE